jgi:hypothetical protein
MALHAVVTRYEIKQLRTKESRTCHKIYPLIVYQRVNGETFTGDAGEKTSPPRAAKCLLTLCTFRKVS